MHVLERIDRVLSVYEQVYEKLKESGADPGSLKRRAPVAAALTLAVVIGQAAAGLEPGEVGIGGGSGKGGE